MSRRSAPLRRPECRRSERSSRASRWLTTPIVFACPARSVSRRPQAQSAGRLKCYGRPLVNSSGVGSYFWGMPKGIPHVARGPIVLAAERGIQPSGSSSATLHKQSCGLFAGWTHPINHLYEESRLHTLPDEWSGHRLGWINDQLRCTGSEPECTCCHLGRQRGSDRWKLGTNGQSQCWTLQSHRYAAPQRKGTRCRR